MFTIDAENKKDIRQKFEVHCGLTARSTADLKFSISDTLTLKDVNVSEALDQEHWPMKRIADLQGDGFPLDDSVSFLDKNLTGSKYGKLGMRTAIGGSVSVKVTATKKIVAVTIAVTSGEGVITANGNEYPVKRIVVIPVNGTSITLNFKSTDENSRIEVASITPGVVMEFDNSNLTNVDLVLRSDLGLTDSTFPISELNIDAYWPDDISEAISNMGDDVPIWYYSGYPGSFSKTREFYLSEQANMENNIISLKAEDSSAKLEEKTFIAQVINTDSSNAKRMLYSKFCDYIKKSGIRPVKMEKAPKKSKKGTENTILILEKTARNLVQEIQSLIRKDEFQPTFVDAGIPTIRHSKETPKWTILEKDCGNIKKEISRNIVCLKSTSEEYALFTKAKRSNKKVKLAKKRVEKGEDYTYKTEGFYWQLGVTNASKKIVTASKIYWIAKKGTTKKKFKKTYTPKGKKRKKTVIKYYNECIVTGKKLSVKNVSRKVYDNRKRPGVTVGISPVAIGTVYDGKNLIYPNYGTIFEKSNKTGSFIWKGDPRMQPRDVFKFESLDGKVEIRTIESIHLRHENGGTIAEITYRNGVV